MSAAEAGAILGKTVTTQPAPGTPSGQCLYRPEGRVVITFPDVPHGSRPAQIQISSVTLTIATGSTATQRYDAAAARFGRDPEDKQISGLGDKAIVVANMLYVLQGTSFAQVAPDGGYDFGRDPRYQAVQQRWFAILEAFARPALQRSGAPVAAATPAATRAAAQTTKPAADEAQRGPSVIGGVVGALAGLVLGALGLLVVAVAQTRGSVGASAENIDEGTPDEEDVEAEESDEPPSVVPEARGRPKANAPEELADPCVCPCPVGMQAKVNIREDVTPLKITLTKQEQTVKAGTQAGTAVTYPTKTIKVAYDLKKKKEIGLGNDGNVNVTYTLTLYYAAARPPGCCESGTIGFKGTVSLDGSYKPMFGDKVTVKASTDVKGEDAFGDCPVGAIEQCKILFKTDYDQAFAFDVPANPIPGLKAWDKSTAKVKGEITVVVTTKKRV